MSRSEKLSSDGAGVDLLALIADDKDIVIYRPRWNQFTGSINATILLQQVVYRWVNNKRKPFYKFTAPCKHQSYRPGDSWQEELGMSRKELETAKKKIGTATKNNELCSSSLVSYWRDRYHKTWWALNEARFVALLGEIYPVGADGVGIQARLPIDDGPMHESGISANAQKGHQPMHESGISTNAQKGHQPMHESGISTNARKGRSYTTKTTYIDNNIDNTETTAEEVMGSAATADSTYAVLLATGIVGKPLAQLSRKPVELALAWAWSCVYEGMERKYVPGFVVNQLRGNSSPPPFLLDLARVWLGMDGSDRVVLRGIADGVFGQECFSDRVPEGYFRDLYEDSLEAFFRLYRADAYLLDW